jgi:hypothetical protein
VPWPAFLHGGVGVEALVGGRLWVLRLLFGLPAGVEVGVPGLTATVAGGLGLEAGDWLDRAVAAAFLDPLVALGVATLDPPPPHPAASLRLLPRASTVIGSALVAAGEEVPPRRHAGQLSGAHRVTTPVPDRVEPVIDWRSRRDGLGRIP